MPITHCQTVGQQANPPAPTPPTPWDGPPRPQPPRARQREATRSADSKLAYGPAIRRANLSGRALATLRQVITKPESMPCSPVASRRLSEPAKARRFKGAAVSAKHRDDPPRPPRAPVHDLQPAVGQQRNGASPAEPVAPEWGSVTVGWRAISLLTGAAAQSHAEQQCERQEPNHSAGGHVGTYCCRLCPNEQTNAQAEDPQSCREAVQSNRHWQISASSRFPEPPAGTTKRPSRSVIWPPRPWWTAPMKSA